MLKRFPFSADTEHATECLDHLQTMLWEGGDHSQDDEITSLICMLQSPLFRQLLGLQDSLQELEQVINSLISGLSHPFLGMGLGPMELGKLAAF